MTDNPFAPPRFTIEWSDMPEELYEAALIAYRMASDRERGHEDCPRRVCRGAGRCLGLPAEKGEPPCLAPLTPFAWGHASDHWNYIQRIFDMIRARKPRR
ncbi:MAG: hypothetical protein IPL47_06775 [Phyllobacteriaceae bacterium]|nr:hypothetical protein [Phyllobacteriaceae bacterium]